MQELKRDTLKKSMTFWDFFFLAFGIYAGVAWVTTLHAWLSNGPAASILGFVVCGILLIPVGLVYTEMTLAMPVTGGSAAFAFKAYGRKGGTLTGWFLALAYIVVCPMESVSVAMILDYMFPVLNRIPLYEVMGFTIYLPTVIIGVLFTLLITLLNYVGVQPSKMFQTITSALMALIVLLLFVSVIFKGDVEYLSPGFAPEQSKFISFFAVLGLAPFFLAGFEAIPQVAEEAKNEKEARKIGKAIILAIFFGVVFYAGISLAASLCAPWQDTVSQFLPTAYAFEQVFGTPVRYAVLTACLLGLLSTWNGCLMAGSRVLFAMGRGRLLPKFFGEAHPKFGTPYKPVVVIGLITAVAPFVGKPVLIPAADIGSLAFIIAWLMVCLSAAKLRNTAPNMKRPYQMPGGRKTAVLGVVICAGISLLMVIPGAPAALVWPTEWIVLAIWCILGVLCYKAVSGGVGKTVTLEEQHYLFFGNSPDKEG